MTDADKKAVAKGNRPSRKRRLTRILVRVLLGCLLVFLIIEGLWYYVFIMFPSMEDVERAMAEIRWEPSPEKRTSMTEKMLNSIDHPYGVKEDHIMRHFLDILADYCLETGDEAVLDPVDMHRINGGFAMDVCSFYDRIMKRPSLSRRYDRPEHRRAVTRCDGI